jgi:hypothetical protein
MSTVAMLRISTPGRPDTLVDLERFIEDGPMSLDTEKLRALPVGESMRVGDATVVRVNVMVTG